MKKLVAISVLFAGLATAVFAQDGGWSNAWKVGFSAKFITEMFYTAKATGDSETTQTTTNNAPGFAAPGSDGTYNATYGKYAKGVTNWFGNDRRLADRNVGGDDRLEVSFENSGENYSVWANFSLDRTNKDWPGGGGGWDWLGHERKLWDYVTEARIMDDYGFKGVAGIFDVGIGSRPVEAAFVGTNATWGSWIATNDLNRFGVQRISGLIHSDHFRTLETWGECFAVGVALGDNYKVTLGYTLLNNWGSWKPNDGDPGDSAKQNSKSSMNGTFMLSGSPIEMINFDLFYAVKGFDNDTSVLPSANFYYNGPDAFWKNLIGLYVQVNGIENLFVSAGYTVSFDAYEAGGFVGNDGSVKPVAFNAPIYSGIDLRLGYSGIDKIGLKFNNRVSFAGTKGDQVNNTVYKDKINLLFSQSAGDVIDNGGWGVTEGWFHWQSLLQANLGFIDGVGLEVALLNRLGVTTSVTDTTLNTGAGLTATTVKTDIDNKTTSNEFRFTVGAKYGAGNVNLGVALFLELHSTAVDNKSTVSTTVGSINNTVKTTEKTNENVFKFGIPVTFQVSF